MSKFKEGDAVIVENELGKFRGTILEEVEGWWKVKFLDESTANVRPSSIKKFFGDREATQEFTIRNVLMGYVGMKVMPDTLDQMMHSLTKEIREGSTSWAFK